MQEAFLSIQEVRRKTGLGRSTVYRLMGSGEFPQAYQISPGRVGWKLSELEEWMSSRNTTAAQKFGAHRGRQVVRSSKQRDEGIA